MSAFKVASIDAKQRGNLGVGAGPNTVVLAKAACYDTSGELPFAILGEAEGVEVVITSVASPAKVGTPSITFCIGYVDPASGLFVELLATTAITDVAQTKYMLVSHHAVDKTNAAVNRMIRDQMCVKTCHVDNVSAVGYSISVTAV